MAYIIKEIIDSILIIPHHVPKVNTNRIYTANRFRSPTGHVSYVAMVFILPHLQTCPVGLLNRFYFFVIQRERDFLLLFEKFQQFLFRRFFFIFIGLLIFGVQLILDLVIPQFFEICFKEISFCGNMIIHRFAIFVSLYSFR